MPQLHLYVSDDVAERVRTRAERESLTTSRYLAKLVIESTDSQWPPGYFDAVCGSCPDFQVLDEPPEPPIEPWA
jgi:hypothetical protein